MSFAVTYGLTSSQIVPGPDFEASQTEHGGWEGSQSFTILKAGVDNFTIRAAFSAGKRATELDTNCAAYYSFLRLVRISRVEDIPGGFKRIVAHYVGFYETNTTNTEGVIEVATYPTYSLRGTLEDRPINQHTKWKALSDAAKNRLGWLLEGTVTFQISSASYGNISVNSDYDDTDGVFFPYYTGGGVWAVATGDELAFATRIAQGITTYKVGSFEWVKRWESTVGMTAAQLNSLSHIVANPPGSPPTPNGNRDWMLVGANQEQTGSGAEGVGYHYTNEISYLLSDRGGWDSFLQDP